MLQAILLLNIYMSNSLITHCYACKSRNSSTQTTFYSNLVISSSIWQSHHWHWQCTALDINHYQWVLCRTINILPHFITACIASQCSILEQVKGLLCCLSAIDHQHLSHVYQSRFHSISVFTLLEILEHGRSVSWNIHLTIYMSVPPDSQTITLCGTVHLTCCVTPPHTSSHDSLYLDRF